MKKLKKFINELKYLWYTKIRQEWKRLKSKLFFISFENSIYLFLQFSVFACIILILLSLVGIVRDSKNLSFDFSTAGINYFFSLINPYKDILTISFTVIGLFLIIIQIKESALSNKINLKEKWQFETGEKINALLQFKTGDSPIVLFINPEIIRFYSLQKDNIFDFLYSNKMKIRNKHHLRIFFEDFIRPNIINFELAAIENELRKFKYENDEKIPPSLLHFRKIIDCLLKPNEGYISLFSDFDELYIDEFERKKNTVASMAYK